MAPGLSLAGVRLVIPDHAVGLPVLRTLSLCTCCRHYPGAASGRRLRSSRPSLYPAFPERVVGSACTSSFSRLAQRSLALRPAHSRRHLNVTCYTEGFSHFVTDLHDCSGLLPAGAFRRVGLAPYWKAPPFTAHTQCGPSTSCRNQAIFSANRGVLRDRRRAARRGSFGITVTLCIFLRFQRGPVIRKNCKRHRNPPRNSADGPTGHLLFLHAIFASMALIYYFAYGSNMLSERLQSRCASAKARRVACADNWVLTFSKRSQDGSGKATISTATGDRVFGVVFDLDESELPALDRFEGVGKGYDRKDNFPIYIPGSQRQLSVVTYIASPSCIDTDLKPFDWYLNLIIAGARQHALPPEYVPALEATASRADSKADRRTRREAMELLGNIHL